MKMPHYRIRKVLPIALVFPAAAILAAAAIAQEFTLPEVTLPGSSEPTIVIEAAPTMPAPAPMQMETPVAQPIAEPAAESVVQPAVTPVAADAAVGQPSTAPAVAGDPASATTAVAALPSGDAALLTKDLSIGEFGVSVMYSAEDINNLKAVLSVHEKNRMQETLDSLNPSEADLLADLLRSAQGEGEKDAAGEIVIQTLPSFYMSSILYRRPGDWTIWVNGQKLTAAKSEDATTGMRVKGISREMVTLAWKPVQLDGALLRWQENQNGTLSKNSKHREVRFSSVELDKEAGEFLITMRPNQTFAADTMQIFEGRYNYSPRSAAAGNPPEQVDASQPSSTDPLPMPELSEAEAAANQSGRVGVERQLADDLIENLMKTQQFIPVPSNPKGAE